MRLYVTLVLILIVAVFLFNGCTPTRYGVPLETWETMSEEQKQERIRAYNDRRTKLQKAREQKKREREDRARAEEARRQAHIEAIYRGEAGTYGDLIRVTIRNGSVSFSGKHRGYNPVSIKVAAGDTRKITITSGKKRSAILWVSYHDGVLLVDSQEKRGKIKAARFVFERGWEKGKIYRPVNTGGVRELRGAEVHVEVIPVHPRHRRSEQPPTDDPVISS